MARFSYKQVVAATDPFTNWSKFAVHPIADRILWVIVNHARVHPNVLTAISFAFAMASAAVFVRGDRTGFVLGAVCYYVAFAIDAIDGPLARLTKTTSKLGAFFDIVGDYFRSLFVGIGFSVGTFRATGDVRVLYLACLFIGVALAHYHIGEVSRRLLGDRPATALGDGKAKGGLSGIAARLGVVPNPFGLTDYEAVAFVIAPLLGRPVEGMIVATTLGILSRLAVLALVVRRLVRAES